MAGCVSGDEFLPNFLGDCSRQRGWCDTTVLARRFLPECFWVLLLSHLGEKIDQMLLNGSAGFDGQTRGEGIQISSGLDLGGWGKGTARPRLVSDARFRALPTKPGMPVPQHRAFQFSFPGYCGCLLSCFVPVDAFRPMLLPMTDFAEGF